MPKKIFVGNLPYEADENQLAKWFHDNGFPADLVTISMDRLSGKPRGFGFVEIHDKLAKACIIACNGQDFLGRTLVINEAVATEACRMEQGSASRISRLTKKN